MKFSLAWVAALVATTAAQGFTQVKPGGVDELVITEDNILNSTTRYVFKDAESDPEIVQVEDDDDDGKEFKVLAAASGPSNALPMTIVNNFQDGMYMYITGQDTSGRQVFVAPDGSYVYPPASGPVPAVITANVAIPLGGRGSQSSFTIPNSVVSGRVWFSVGTLVFYSVTDGNGNGAIVMPAAVNPLDANAGVVWGFIEFNYDSNGMFANISYVDFVGLELGMGLTVNGQEQVVQGLQGGALNNICNGLVAQSSADGAPWSTLCQGQGTTATRALSPNLYISAHAEAFQGYFDSYVNQVWSQYTSQPLTINGITSCTASGNDLNCQNDNRPFVKPTSADIFGCNSGPFAIMGGDSGVHTATVPILCAAFNRGTYLLQGGNVQPGLSSSSYYTTSPANHYARLVHQYEVGGLGYAFSYDDVTSAGENTAGTVAGSFPTNFKVTIGGWS